MGGAPLRQVPPRQLLECWKLPAHCWLLSLENSPQTYRNCLTGEHASQRHSQVMPDWGKAAKASPRPHAGAPCRAHSGWELPARLQLRPQACLALALPYPAPLSPFCGKKPLVNHKSQNFCVKHHFPRTPWKTEEHAPSNQRGGGGRKEHKQMVWL